MEFYVHLIKAKEGQTPEAAACLEQNCTYVDKDYYIFEGDLFWLEEDNVIFEHIGDGIVPVLGDMTKEELIEFVKNVFEIDIEEK